MTNDPSKLTIHFEGFWQCRLATDPDPSREPRGVSGYVFAVGDEPDLDGIIRLQDDGKVVLRDPFPPYREALNPRFGVYVTEVEHDGQTLAGHVLLGAQVLFLDGARFVLRNQIVADGVNRLVPPIVPFTFEIKQGDIVLRRHDPLDPDDPKKPIWKMTPEQYQSRMPVRYQHLSDEVVETIFPGISDANAYFSQYFEIRKEYLELKLANCHDPVQREAYKTRLFAIQANSSLLLGSPGLIENRLGLQTTWGFPIRGVTLVSGQQRLGVEACTERPWHTRFWMGGWDGDLMLGFMGGVLEIPLK